MSNFIFAQNDVLQTQVVSILNPDTVCRIITPSMILFLFLGDNE